MENRNKIVQLDQHQVRESKSYLADRRNMCMPIIRWAMGGSASNFKSTMVFLPNKSWGYTKGNSPNHRLGCLAGVVSYFQNLYVIKFFPRIMCIRWERFSERDLDVYNIDREMYNNHQKNRDGSADELVADGFMQCAFSSCLVSQVIRMCDTWNLDVVQDFFSDYTFIDPEEISNIVINNLNKQSEDTIYFFLVCLAIIDPSTKWNTRQNERYDDETETVTHINVFGEPSFFFSSADGYISSERSYEVVHAPSRWDIDDCDFTCWARRIFWELLGISDRYYAKANANTRK